MNRPVAILAALLVLALAGCASAPRTPAPASERSSAPPAEAPPTARRGAFYKDDGPGDNPPDLASIPDAQPRAEPLHRFANRPYQVLGRDYTPLSSLTWYKERGIGSWYGRRFHGQPTSSGERYDMYGMTAAHPTLPIPSYARVTNVTNGRSVVVRINDRGPFHSGRIIDLSYTAAWKLGYADAGSATVEVEALAPPGRTLAGAPPSTVEASPATPAPATAQPVTTAAAGSGVYLQLGSFSARENAEGLRQRVLRELAWIREELQIQPSGNLFRLQVGPYRSREEAGAVADRIRTEMNFAPAFVVR